MVNIGGSLWKETEAAEKTTKDYYWIGVQESIDMFSKP